MPDSADDLILRMQHLAASARTAIRARFGVDQIASLKSRAQQFAAQAQVEIDAAQKAVEEAEALDAKARGGGLSTLEAADLLVASRTQAAEARSRLTKARARYQVALDQMDATERADWARLLADSQAETHAQLAEGGADGPAPGPLDTAAPPELTPKDLLAAFKAEEAAADAAKAPAEPPPVAKTLGRRKPDPGSAGSP